MRQHYNAILQGRHDRHSTQRSSGISPFMDNITANAPISPVMDYVIRQLTTKDEPILWEMLYQGLSSPGKKQQPAREIVRRPEFARYVEGWGRCGDTGFVAHNKKDGMLLGAVWLRKPVDKPDAPPELALSVKPEHRKHGIGTALLTQLVRSNPEQSTISLSFVTGKPVLRLYERFGFKVVEEAPNAVVMHRDV
jgi:ribosomal protein S18 acetylase RimI-like enzyme